MTSYGLSELQHRPAVFSFIGGHADCRATETLLKDLASPALAMADRGSEPNGTNIRRRRTMPYPNSPESGPASGGTASALSFTLAATPSASSLPPAVDDAFESYLESQFVGVPPEPKMYWLICCSRLVNSQVFCKFAPASSTWCDAPGRIINASPDVSVLLPTDSRVSTGNRSDCST